MFRWLFKKQYNVTIYNSDISSMRRKDWRDVISWCEKTFDKKNYTCDILLASGRVDRVIIRLKRKEDYTQLALTWLYDFS